jgi:hypothetical protein
MPFLLAFGFVALVVELPVYFVTVNGITPQSAGLLLMLLTGPTLVMPIVVSSFAHRVPRQLLLVLTMSADVTRAAGADAFTAALHVGLWAIAALSLVGAIAVGLLARGGTAPQAEPAVPDEVVEDEVSASRG